MKAAELIVQCARCRRPALLPMSLAGRERHFRAARRCRIWRSTDFGSASTRTSLYLALQLGHSKGNSPRQLSQRPLNDDDDDAPSYQSSQHDH